IFFPEQWSPFFMSCSKNEAFVLLLAYRKQQVNMTEIAEYLKVPLNTVTGIVSRLEKKDMVKRERSVLDKRVVTVSLTETGFLDMRKMVEQAGDYCSEIMGILSDEEKDVLFGVVQKVFKHLNQGKHKKEDTTENKKRIKQIVIE
ncbi:MAG: MarR family transcriptional regulator, partial [Eubacterium sp.]